MRLHRIQCSIFHGSTSCINIMKSKRNSWRNGIITMQRKATLYYETHPWNQPTITCYQPYTYPCDFPVWAHPLLGQLEHLPCASFQRMNSRNRGRRNGSLALVSMTPACKIQKIPWYYHNNLKTESLHVDNYTNACVEDDMHAQNLTACYTMNGIVSKLAQGQGYWWSSK